MLTQTLVGLDWRVGMLNPIAIGGYCFFILQGLIIGLLNDLYIQRKEAEQRLEEQIRQRSSDLERAQATEQQLESVLEQSADAVFITEKDTEKILLVNRALLELTGMRREYLIGEKPYCFMPEVGTTYRTTLGDEITIDMQYYEQSYLSQQKLLNEGMIRGWEYYVINGRGELVPVEANVTHLLDTHGNRTGAISIVRDETGHKLNQAELNRTNEFLNNVIENSIDCIIISDETGHITFINQAGLDMVGYSLEEMLGKAVMEFFSIQEGRYETTAGDAIWLSTEDIEAVYNRIAELLETGRVSNYTSFLEHKDERLIEVEHNITLLFDQKGTRIGSVAITRDRSMSCRMEREINKQSELLSQANRELESFAYSVSHDLRAPLRSISGFSTALEEDFGPDLPEAARGFLQRIQKSSERMGMLIDDLLNLSRVSRYDMRREQVNLSALAGEVLAQLREHTPDRSIACTIQPGITTVGDGHLLRIVFENLIGNAWKYTARQGKPEIFFGRADDADPRAPAHERSRPIFCVRDNGVGFDMAYIDKLFTPFQRLHAEKDFPGTGIGLATVQRIVHRHGGRIWARSTPGKETTFYFTLG
jgi:signal transduction histidine kinase